MGLTMIETERLILRQPIAEDFEPTAAMFSDPNVVAHIGGAISRSEAWSRFLRDYGHWALEGFGQFSIIEKSSGSYIGKTGFAKFERDLGLHANTAVETSWTLGSHFHGKGFAKEAAQAAHEWFDANRQGPTACLIAQANAPSIKLATMLGYVNVDRIEQPAHFTLVFKREP